MSFFYITRVNIPSRSAQSMQISDMCKAFSSQLTEFKLISPENVENSDIQSEFIWLRPKIKTRLRQLEFLIKASLHVIKQKPKTVYTRDIAIAFFLSFLTYKVAYEAHKEPKSFIAKFLIKLLSYKSNFYLICISNALSIFYQNKYKYQSKFVCVAHDGVFIEDYDKLRQIKKNDLREKLKLPLKRIIMTHTGSLYKGRDPYLFECIVKNFKEILFVQVGGSDHDIYKYKKYYKRYNNIIFVNHQDKSRVRQYQIASDILFYALTKENKLWWCTSPLKLFEYMATGNPVIASEIGSVTEILNDRNSILYSPTDEESILQAVKYFIENRDKSLQRSHKALDQVRSKYLWSIRSKRILDFIVK